MTEPVVVVGGGPSGLTAASALARAGVQVTVLEREVEAGGIPRHSDHPGYGMRDLHRFLTGPAYARRLVAAATAAGVTIRTGAMVTGWHRDGGLEVTSPSGRELIVPRATVLATGARERPRAARLVPGDRPSGVYTTGQLQNLVHLHHGVPGTRAVVVGAELVSWSAVMTLREAGCRTVAMLTRHESPESYRAFSAVGRALWRVPVRTRTRVVAVHGRGRVQAVEVEHLGSGARSTVECDAVVFTGDWVPDNELARAAGVRLDAAMRGPLVDTQLRTDRPGLFAIGNLVHPVETADLAALDGVHVRDAVLAHLSGAAAADDAVRLLVDPPLRWVAPGLVRPGDGPPAQGHLVLWTDALVRRPRVTITQQGRVIARLRTPWPTSPGRAFHVPARWLTRLRGTHDVTVHVD